MTDISKEQERVRNALLQKTATGKVAADIVKFVVEFIYNHLKKEFNVDSDGKQIITRCKKVLLSLTEELIERVQESTLIPQVPACDNNASVSLNTNSDRKSLPLSPLSATNSFSCRLHRTCPVPEYFISISIPTLKEVHVKGVIIDGETTTYTIHTQAKQLSRISNSAFGPLNITEKRHSDLKKLYNFICKENPDYILPPLPSYGSLTLDESKEEFRRRNFTLWLEFILNLSVVQNSADITNSFTGLQGWCNEYGMTSMISVSPSCPNMSDIFVTTMQLKRSVVLPKYLRFAKINVFKDLATISKQLKYLQLGSSYFIESWTLLNKLFSSSSMIRNDFNNCLDCWKSWEDNNSNNSFHLGELSNALLRINTCVSDSSEMFRSYLFEPFTLLYGVVLQRSAELTEKNLKNFVAIIGQPSSLSSTAKPVDTDKADDEQTTMNNCCSFIDSWDAFSHLRSTMILARLSALAKLQFETHQYSTKLWADVQKNITKYDSEEKEDIRFSIHEDLGVRFKSNTFSRPWEYVSTLFKRARLPVGMRKNPTIQKLFTTEDENAPHQESNSIVEDSTRTSCSSADISDTFGEEKNHHVNQKQPKKFQRKISSSANSNNQRLINSKISSKATPTNFFGKAVEPAQSVLVSDAAPTPLDKIPESNVTLNTENSNSTNNTENTKFPSNSVPRVDETHSQQVFEPLPPGWMQGCTDDGRIYFYHTIARISRWNPPTQDVVIAVEERLNKTHSAAEEAISKRMQDLETDKLKEEKRKELAEALRNEIRVAVGNWQRNPHNSKPRDIGELLSSLHQIVSFITPENITPNGPLNAQSTPEEIKKSYLKAARLIHPDKLPGNLILEEKLVAEEVFIVLSEQYQIYKASH